MHQPNINLNWSSVSKPVLQPAVFQKNENKPKGYTQVITGSVPGW